MNTLKLRAYLSRVFLGYVASTISVGIIVSSICNSEKINQDIVMNLNTDSYIATNVKLPKVEPLVTSVTTKSTAKTSENKITVLNREIEEKNQNITTTYISTTCEITDTQYEAEYEQSYNTVAVTDWEYTLLLRIVQNEYGSDWVDVYEKTKIVATVFNIANYYYDGDIEAALDNACVPYGFDKYYAREISDSVYQAVDSYLSNPSAWDNWYATSWCGDGTWNYFE